MATVEEIVQAIKELSPEKRDEVRRQLVLLWRVNSRQAVGKSSSVPIRRARPRRPPIQVKGKPVSETVIEDRR